MEMIELFGKHTASATAVKAHVVLLRRARKEIFETF